MGVRRPAPEKDTGGAGTHTVLHGRMKIGTGPTQHSRAYFAHGLTDTPKKRRQTIGAKVWRLRPNEEAKADTPDRRKRIHVRNSFDSFQLSTKIPLKLSSQDSTSTGLPSTGTCTHQSSRVHVRTSAPRGSTALFWKNCIASKV